MKELQANLPSEVIEMVEERFASLAESIERSNEMLAKRIDQMAETIGERQGRRHPGRDRSDGRRDARPREPRARAGPGGKTDPRIELE